MQLCCPRCRSPVEVPHQLSRFFNMPVACHLCRRVFAVPPQGPLHDSPVPNSPAPNNSVPNNSVPNSLLRALDRSSSAERCSHERTCPACLRTIRIPGLDPAIGPLDLSCPYCQANFRLEAGGGIQPRIIAVALGLGIVIGLAVLWLDHEGMIALRQLQLAEPLREWARQLRHWIVMIS